MWQPTSAPARSVAVLLGLLVVMAVPVGVAATHATDADATGPTAAAAGTTTQAGWTTNLTAAAGAEVTLGVRSDLAGAGDTAFVSGAGIGENRLFAVHAANGSVRWSRSLGPGAPEGLSAPARVAGNGVQWPVSDDWSPENVFVGDYAGTLHALDAGTGTTDWTARTGFGSYVGDPLLGDRTVYVTAYDPANGTTHLQAYGAADGSREWSTELGPGIGIASPAGTSDRLVVAAGETVYGVDPASGTVEWTTELGSPAFEAPVVAPDAGVAVFTTEDGTVSAVRLGSGEVDWRADAGGNATQPTLAGGSVVVGGDGLRAFDPADGGTVWTAPLGTVTAPPVARQGAVYAVAGGDLHTVTATNGTETRSVAVPELGTLAAAPATTDGTVVLADTAGTVASVAVAAEQPGDETPTTVPGTTEGEPSPTSPGAEPSPTSPEDEPSPTSPGGSPAGTTTSGDGPGFGVVAAIVALLGMLAVRRRLVGDR